MIMNRFIFPAGILLMILLSITGCATAGSPENPNVIFQDDFTGDNVQMGKPVNWHWVPYAADVWVNDADDVPGGYGPNVLTLGRTSTSTAHIALKPELLRGHTDYQVTVLWVDRRVVGAMGDSDFHVGVRAQKVDFGMEAPEKCYEVEIDGDDADATNLMPEDGPTHFHLFIRGDLQKPLDHADESEFPPPVRNTWYWTKLRVAGHSLKAKTWIFGTEEPDWQLEGTDDSGLYTEGTVRIGVWSGIAEAAYLEIEAVEEIQDGSAVSAEPEEERQETEDVWESEIFRLDESGNTVYGRDGEGNRIPDFSYAGYRNGNVPLPRVPSVVRLTSASGDRTQDIQDAIDEVSLREPDAAGFRGAVELAEGEYQISGTLYIHTSGVVLRGAGSGTGSTAAVTTLKAVGSEPADRDVIIAGSGKPTSWEGMVPGSKRMITSSTVPLGDRVIRIEGTEGYEPGDNIIIYHPASEEWIQRVNGGGTASDTPWSAGEVPLVFNRYIENISGDEITLDAPLYAELDRSLSQSYIYKHDRFGIEENIGIEHLRIDIIPDDPEAEIHALNGIALTGIEDGWVKNVTVTGFQLSGIIIQTGSRITVKECEALDPIHTVEPGYLYNFNAYKASQQILFTGCFAANGRHHFISNGMSWNSGIVFHKTRSSGAWAASEGHRRWTMGILFDNHVELDGPRAGGTPILLGLYNRGDYGTGHGWSAVNSVIWNSDAADGYVVVQKPPLGQNFGIGVRGGRITGRGPFDQPPGYLEGSRKTGLVPGSLYEAQLNARD